jgi:hypothetical protein
MFVIFYVRNLHVILLSMYEFRENEDKESHSLLVDINEFTFTCAP